MRLHAVTSVRLGRDTATMGFWLSWHGLALLLVLLAPSQFVLGSGAWTAPAAHLAQFLLGGAAYVIFAWCLAYLSGRPGGCSLLAALMAAAASFGAILLVPVTLRPDIPFSRAAYLAAAAIGTVLALAPYLVTSARLVVIAALAMILAFVIVLGWPRSPVATGVVERRVVPTALGKVTMTYHRGLVTPPPVDGGAIEPLGAGFLLVTGDGTFYELSWHDKQQLASRRLALGAPMDRAAFLADQEDPKRPLRLRVTDLALHVEGALTKVFVAHQSWNRDARCFTLRVSVAEVDSQTLAPTVPAGRWRTVFETWPCLQPSGGFDDAETGGRLAWLGDGLLLTVGDHGLSGLEGPPTAQLDDNAYGKVHLLDTVGGSRLFSRGHRNPQGLVVDNDQRIWSTEHGPQGGDEINVLVGGANYGWPLATYGTNYGQPYWPLAPNARNHGTYVEPVHAFVPSIAISSLIQVRAGLFPAWRGDLLVGSLRPQNLYRLRTRADRVLYVEPLSVQREVRDLAEGADGRILLWTDEYDVVVLAPDKSPPVGSVIFERCRACHESAAAPSNSPAPTLRGIVGRSAGSVAGFRYSPALQGDGTPWTEARLDAFLSDPNAFLPGSRMMTGRVVDPIERRALIEFLRDYR